VVAGAAELGLGVDKETVGLAEEVDRGEEVGVTEEDARTEDEAGRTETLNEVARTEEVGTTDEDLAVVDVARAEVEDAFEAELVTGFEPDDLHVSLNPADEVT
jgi:hypothetical protein